MGHQSRLQMLAEDDGPDTHGSPTDISGLFRLDACRPSVLVLADLAVALTYEERLQEHGVEVRTAWGADDALRKLGRDRVDMVVLDLARAELAASAFFRGLRSFHLDHPLVILVVHPEAPPALCVFRPS